MNNELNGAYLEDFNIIKKYVEKHCQRGTDRDEALQSLRAIYLDAQEGAAALEEIRGESAEDYAKEIASALPTKKHAKLTSVLKTALIVVVSFAIGGSVLWLTSDVYAVKMRGYAFVLQNPEKFVISTSKLNPSDVESFLYCSPNGIEKQSGYCEFIGMNFKNIFFDESTKKLTVSVSTDSATSTETNVTEIITPKIPVYDKENRLLYMVDHGAKIRIGETTYSALIDNFYTSRDGNVCFDLVVNFNIETDPADIAEYINSGKAVAVFFNKIYKVSYSYIGVWAAQNSGSAFFNSPFGTENNYPEPLYDFVVVTAETEENIVYEVSLVVDKDTREIKLLYEIDCAYVPRNLHSLSFKDPILYDGKIYIEYNYKLFEDQKIQVKKFVFDPKELL